MKADLRKQLEMERLQHITDALQDEPGTPVHRSGMDAARMKEQMIRCLDAEGSPENWMKY